MNQRNLRVGEGAGGTFIHSLSACTWSPINCYLGTPWLASASIIAGSERYQVPQSVWDGGTSGHSVHDTSRSWRSFPTLRMKHKQNLLSIYIVVHSCYMPEGRETLELDSLGEKWLAGTLLNFCIGNKLVPLDTAARHHWSTASIFFASSWGLSDRTLSVGQPQTFTSRVTTDGQVLFSRASRCGSVRLCVPRMVR